MGAPMARNLIDAGFEVRVFNRTRAKAEKVAGNDGTIAESPRDAVKEADIVVSMLADDRAVEDAVSGERGILAGLPRSAVHVSMSTISPATGRQLAKRHAERGVLYVAAPVFGRPEAAAARKLWICISGASEGREKARPVLEALGQGMFDFGDEPGAASVVKLAGNFLIASALEAMAEAWTLAEKNGIARRSVADLFSTTLFACPIYKNYGDAIAAQRYSPAGFRLALGLKDIGLALETAAESGVPMPLASLLRDRLLAGVARGRGDLDWTGLARAVSEDAGLPETVNA